MAQSIARNAIRTLLRVKTVQLIARCGVIGNMGDVSTYESNKPVSSKACMDVIGSLLHVYRLSI